MILKNSVLKEFGVTLEEDLSMQLLNILKEKFQTNYLKSESIHHLLSNPEILNILYDKVFVNETYFFRENKHFDILRKHIFPEFNNHISILSSASSIGCEAYSIAMVCEDFKQKNKMFDYKITAVDINSHNIDKLIKGKYGTNSIRKESESYSWLYENYLVHEEKRYAVSEKLKSKVSAYSHNLFSPINEKFDIIFCRNALIYLDIEHKQKLLDNLISSLKDNGYLFVGVSETASVSALERDDLENCLIDGVYFFKKIKEGFRKKLDRVIKVIEEAPVFHKPFKERKKETHVSFSSNDKYVSRKELDKMAADFIEVLRKDELHNISVKFNVSETSGLRFDEILLRIILLINSKKFSEAMNILTNIRNLYRHELIDYFTGEVLYFQNEYTEALMYYKKSLGMNAQFWPSMFRIAQINKSVYKAADKEILKKAVSAIKSEQDKNYEYLIGAFSKEYYIQVLDKIMAEK